MALNRSFGLISLALALVDNLLEQKRSCDEDQDNRPDLERRLGIWGADVCGGLVRTRGLAGLAKARGGGLGSGEAAREKLAAE